MLTLFSTPKPFRGHIGIIQRNAIRSWTLLHPDCEVILFGDEEGAREAAREFAIRHEPRVLRNESGTKFLNYLFARAEEIARHDLLCYINCDIILTPPFLEAVQRVASWSHSFLMVGRRWDVDITAPWGFDSIDWPRRLQEFAGHQGRQQSVDWIDYFVFRSGLYRDIPAFVIGRVGWDQWLLWKARSLKVPVVDASAVVMAVHQNHDYSYHPEGKTGVWNDEQAQRNYELAGGPKHIYSIDDATHTLTAHGIRPNRWHSFAPLRRAVARTRSRGWFTLLSLTRPLRHRLGLRQATLASLSAKVPWLKSR